MVTHPAQQRLRDQAIEPTLEVIASHLNETTDAYLTFVQHVSSLDIDFNYLYYPDGQAWLGKGVYRWLGKRGGKKELNLFWCSIWDDYFKITLYFPESSRSLLLSLNLSFDTKKMISDTKIMSDKFRTLPLVFDIKMSSVCDDVVELIQFKIAHNTK